MEAVLGGQGRTVTLAWKARHPDAVLPLNRVAICTWRKSSGDRIGDGRTVTLGRQDRRPQEN